MAIPTEVGAAFVPDLGSGQLWFGFVAGVVVTLVVLWMWRVISRERELQQDRRQRQYERDLEVMRTEIRTEIMKELGAEEVEEDAAG
jgi:membrane protein implicated in regulation of membrane protease activity